MITIENRHFRSKQDFHLELSPIGNISSHIDDTLSIGTAAAHYIDDTSSIGTHWVNYPLFITRQFLIIFKWLFCYKLLNW